MRHVERRTFRNDVLSVAGLTSADCVSASEKPLQGPLSDLRASNIYNGPFRICITSDPSLHLRFDPNKGRPTILVLGSDTICKLALLDLTGLMAYNLL